MPELHQAFEKLLADLREQRASLETEKHFYLGALNHVGMGLIVIDSENRVRFSNRSMERIMGTDHITTLEGFNKLRQGLAATVMNMTANNKELVKVVLHNEVVNFSIRCSAFRIENDLYRIISFQDIKSEIEKNEAEAWQKLIRILSHEIMNSVSPITLTSSGLIHLLEKQDAPDGWPGSLRNEVTEGLQAIRKRSKGLASFVENYNAINHLPQPLLTLTPVSVLFGHVEQIMKEDLQKNDVHLELQIAPPALVLHADEQLIGQILINMVKNAIQALEKATAKRILLSAYTMNDHVRISVTDNGAGIEPALLDTIFVPFYTTREKGNGIGLSLSREIMKLHGGGIRVYSDPGKETTFTLIF